MGSSVACFYSLALIVFPLPGDHVYFETGDVILASRSLKGIAMAMSSITVVSNSLRLYRRKI